MRRCVLHLTRQWSSSRTARSLLAIIRVPVSVSRSQKSNSSSMSMNYILRQVRERTEVRTFFRRISSSIERGSGSRKKINCNNVAISERIEAAPCQALRSRVNESQLPRLKHTLILFGSRFRAYVHFARKIAFSVDLDEPMLENTNW